MPVYYSSMVFVFVKEIEIIQFYRDQNNHFRHPDAWKG